jgi:hypothetical protein
MHQEIVTLRQTRTTALRQGWLEASMGIGTTSRLCALCSQYRTRHDEAWRLEFRDVTVADHEDLGKTIPEIEVREKRGVGYCKSMPGAVRPFERLRSRLRPASVSMIDEYYAAHIKTSLDAAATNVMQPKKNKGKTAIQNTQASPADACGQFLIR